MRHTRAGELAASAGQKQEL
uniref:Uncharacterized protein n=1 Tax=Anguilla anguilla TaxID=7936 RepID=A0A0E9SC72_ANGAN